MGSKTTQQTSQQTSTPINQAALQQIYGQVAGAASTPYTPYTGELTAGINGQQTAGINATNAASNYASPYIQSAAGLTQNAANPLTAAQIQQYQNPYTQNVVNATQAQFNDQNAQAQNSLKGTAAMQGALGGDRQAVAQSQLAGQQQLAQAPTIANLYANSYNSGLQTAGQQFQQNPLAAAGQLGNLGVAGQTAALQGAGAQIGAGTLQQQTQQAADTANYGQYQAAQGFPYQQAAFLEQYGLPSALAQGSTSNGVQTGQGPNNLSPYLGAAVTAAGLFAKDGGAINGYAPGGGVGYINAPDYINANAGYIPSGQASQNTLQAPSLSFMKQPQSTNPLSNADFKGLGGLGTSLKNDFGSASFGGGSMLSGDAWGGDKANPLEGLSASDYGYASGGFVKAIHDIHRTIKGARKGHFDDGGDVSFADRFQPASDNPFADMTRGQAIRTLAAENGATFAPDSIPGGEPAPVANRSDAPINPDGPFRMPDQGAVQAWRDGADQPNPAVMADSGVPLPKEIINPDNAPPVNPMTSAYDAPRNPLVVGAGTGPTGANGQPTDVLPAPTHEDQSGGHGLFGLSDKTKQSLIAAGLGLMASRSPFLGQALGEGGLQGLKSYSDQTAAEQASAEKAATRAQEQQRIDLQAKQLADTLDQHRRAAASADLVPGPNGTMIPNQAQLDFLRKKHDLEDDKVKFGTIAYDPAGLPIQGFIDSTNKKLFTADGKPYTPQAGTSPTPAAASAVANPITDGVVKANAAQAATPFDYSRQSPIVEKGLDVPDPAPVAGKSKETLKADAEMYLQTGKLPPIVARGQSPVAVLQNAYRTAVQNYANARAASMGQTPEQIVNMWRTAPGMLKFIDGPDGRATVSLGTAVRHLDTLKQYIDAFNASDTPRIRQLQAVISREFGQSAATNIDAASAIVGPEIVKAIGIAGAGTRDERLNAETMFRSGSGQAKSAINVVEHLLSGQLEGKERQARNSGVTPERFKDLVGDRPYEILKSMDKGGSTSGGLVEGRTGTDAQGRKVIVKNGKIVPQ